MLKNILITLTFNMASYLLTFNKNWADEHSVSVFACMTENEYNNWLEMELGELEENYEEELKKFEERLRLYENYKNERKERGLNNKSVKDWSEDEMKWNKENYQSYIHDGNRPISFRSGLMAYLGNSGECFEEYFHSYRFGKDFVEANIVKVYEVDDTVKEIFDTANLNNLSLYNIFQYER